MAAKKPGGTVNNSPLAILQVSPSDIAGGAERSAKNLFERYKKIGHESWLAVGSRHTTDQCIYEIPNELYRNVWVRAWSGALAHYDQGPIKIKGFGRLLRLMRDTGQPMRKIQQLFGMDDFDYPATRILPDLPPRLPDIIHFHNLHGGFFDLRCLPEMSHRIPSVLNLRDAWLVSGHCAFSFDCERWKTGCGHCPDLSIFPAVKRDGTAHNWEQKKEIFQQSSLFVTTPSQWLMNRVEQSIVAPAIVEKRVIPNGIDTDIFCPGDKAEARKMLNLEQDVFILLTAANGIRNNIWKDYKSMRGAIEILAQREDGRKILLLAVGESSPPEMIGNIKVQFEAFQKDPRALAQYYRAADVYLHTAKVESFGNVLLEARACGTPVVTTAVGGIPEHVKGLNWDQAPADIPTFDSNKATGILVQVDDRLAFAQAISILLEKAQLHAELGRNGFHDITAHFSLDIQANRFIDWYREILLIESKKQINVRKGQ